MFYRAALAAVCLLAISCSRGTSGTGIQRIAVLRFENLSADASIDWMGRAFSEILSRDLAQAPGTYAIPRARLHALDAAFGKRPTAAPGISSERSLALASGANRLAYGEYWLRGGKIEARVSMEELPAGAITRVLSISASDVVSAADALARQLSPRAAPYSTRNPLALQRYVLGLEADDPAQVASEMESAVRADPGFPFPYEALAEWRAQQQDRAGAVALINQALAQAGRMSELDRVQLAFDAAGFRGDAAAGEQALAAWARLTPNDPVVWRSVAEAAMSRHDYPQAVKFYQAALSAAPDDPALLNQLGYASAYTGDFSGAVRALERYQSVRPADVNALDSLGDVNFLFGRFREAENSYLQAAKQDPSFQGGGEFAKAAMARLMSGDLNGANALHKQYLDRRAAARDPLGDYYQAEWMWLTGGRKDGYQHLLQFARSSESSPLKQLAAAAYSELAVWSVALGNRGEGMQMGEKAVAMSPPASAATAELARFLAQPSASVAEWTARAGRAFAQPSAEPVKQRALAYALLLERQFSAAFPILNSLYQSGRTATDEAMPLLLAWCDLETGRGKDAPPLLRFNPLPSSGGVHPFQVFYFPRLFYLRGRAAALDGHADAAHEQFRLFLQLSGDTPLIWGEEAQAR